MMRPRVFALGLIGVGATVALVVILAVVVFDGDSSDRDDQAASGGIDAGNPFGMPLTEEEEAQLESGALPPEEAGRLTYFANGCATCHGTAAQGTTIGPRLRERVDEEELLDAVRRGRPGGMPAYSTVQLSDQEARTILIFLETSLPAAFSDPDEQ